MSDRLGADDRGMARTAKRRRRGWSGDITINIHIITVYSPVNASLGYRHPVLTILDDALAQVLMGPTAPFFSIIFILQIVNLYIHRDTPTSKFAVDFNCSQIHRQNKFPMSLSNFRAVYLVKSENLHCELALGSHCNFPEAHPPCIRMMNRRSKLIETINISRHARQLILT